MKRHALLLVPTLLLTACGGLISPAQEVEIGKGVDQEIEGEYRIVHQDDPLAKWARDLVKRLVDASAEFRDPAEFGGYKVEVIADDQLVNAFAAPGGYTYLSTGLILQAKTCGEIAGVMGHELGHVTEKHSVGKLEQAFAVEQLAGMFLGESLTKDAATTIWAFLQSTKFSQDDESEADSVGLQIAFNAGYNPYGLVDFFKKIREMERKAGGSGPQFMSSHPATADRIREVSAEIEKRYGDAVTPGKSQTYDCRGTKMSLAEAQKRIANKQVKTR